MDIRLRQTIVPISITLILSSCFVLAWYLYQTVYLPLFNTTTPTITANDYAVPSAKLDSTIAALDAKQNSTVDFAGVPLPFTPNPKP